MKPIPTATSCTFASAFFQHPPPCLEGRCLFWSLPAFFMGDGYFVPQARSLGLCAGYHVPRNRWPFGFSSGFMPSEGVSFFSANLTFPSGRAVDFSALGISGFFIFHRVGPPHSRSLSFSATSRLLPLLTSGLAPKSLEKRL